jgi:hypothetical protein
VHINVVRHPLAVHLRPEHRVLEHQVLRDHTGFENLAAAVDVADVGVDRLHALLEARPQHVPFGSGENARQHVERNQAFLGVGVAVDREGDADAAEYELGLAPPIVKHVRRNVAQPVRELDIGWAQRSVAAVHFIECWPHGRPGFSAPGYFTGQSLGIPSF